MQPREIKIALFPKSEDEKKSDKSPDFSGVLELNGEKIQLVGWKQESKAGKPYISVKESVPMEDTQNSHGNVW